VTQMSSWLAI